jgi:PhnB protein
MKNAPEGWHSVTPRLFAQDVSRLVEFLKVAFEAQGAYEQDRPTQLRIGDSIVMVSGVDVREPNNAFLYLYVENTDDTYARALEAGAQSLEQPRDMPYGDRRAMIKDPAGNTWQIATHDAQAYQEFLKQRGE